MKAATLRSEVEEHVVQLFRQLVVYHRLHTHLAALLHHEHADRAGVG